MSSIKQAVSEMSSRFEARYGHLWVASNDIDDRENLREKLYQWIEELERESICPSLVSKVTKLVLDKAEFSNYPPNLNRFIFLCNEMNRMMNSGDEGKIYLELKRLDEKFSFIYSRLWVENDKDKSKRRLDFWKKELTDEDISPEVISTTVKNIHKKGCYSQYPPSLNQFVMECLFTKSNEIYTDPDIAFIKACSKDDDMHVTIKCSRRIIGSHTLRQSKDKYIRTLFEKVYIEECRKFVNDPEGYALSFEESSGAKASESVIDDENESSDLNKDFFKNLVLKNNTQ
jgi:hypothetical protein